MFLRVLHGKMEKKLKEFPDNYFDAIVTDSPYMLTDEPDIIEVMKAWTDHGYYQVKTKGGFMNKEWDSFVPQPVQWKEVFRVLKPGGHLLTFAGTRTYDWMVMSLRFAGFEIRDQLQWIYGSGFPKSLNISKAIDRHLGVESKVISKREHPTLKDKSKVYRQSGTQYHATNSTLDEWDITVATTDEAQQYEGYGTQLKPAYEPIVLARKPISEKSIAANVLKWGTGGINIDACRVTYEKGGSLATNPSLRSHINAGNGGNIFTHEEERRVVIPDNKGRFPANIILSHHPDCEYLGMKKIKAISGGTGEASTGSAGGHAQRGKAKYHGANAGGLGDENGMEEVEHWNCVHGCPVKILDEQSGTLRTGAMKPSHNIGNSGRKAGSVYGDYAANSYDHPGDQGGASRFFYCAKASTTERNIGLEKLGFKKKQGHSRFDKCRNCGGYMFQQPDRPSHCQCENPEREDLTVEGNHHPTVKPVELMRYLVRLVTPPNGIVLDPFNGSGSTGIACKEERFSYVGIEEDKEYCEISLFRINAWEVEKKNILGGVFGSILRSEKK